MDLSISTRESARLVRIVGELDADNCADLGAAALADLDGVQVTELDMSEISFIDSSAISELLRIKGELADSQIDFTVTAASEQVTRVLEITGLSETLGLA